MSEDTKEWNLKYLVVFMIRGEFVATRVLGITWMVPDHSRYLTHLSGNHIDNQSQ